MKRIIVVLAYILLLPAVVFAQETANSGKEGGDLTVIIVGFKSDNGDVKIAMSNSKEDFSSKRDDAEPFKSAVIKIQDKKAELVFKDLPFGEYAVRLFHDKNGNGKLDTNFLKIPKEDYGFSNNARGSFGPPDYEKAKFDFRESTTIEITVRKPKKQ